MKSFLANPQRAILRPTSVVALAVALAGTACSPETEPSAFGQWKSRDNKSTLNLHPDGTCDGTDEYGRHSRGTFTLREDQRLQISLEVRDTNQQTGQILSDKSQGTLRMLVQANSLILTDGNGTVSRFKRVK